MPTQSTAGAQHRRRAITRNATLDYARLLAAFGIVLFHVDAPGRAVGYAALPFFLMALLCLAWPAAQRDSFGRYARNRATRLLVPFAVWSGIFGLLKLAEVMLTGVSLGSEFKPYMLVTGPAIHLWFLPFACVASLMAFPLARAGLSDPDRTALWGKVLALTALNAVGLLALALQQDTAWPTPYAQWAFVSPAVCVGLGFAVAQGKPALPALATGAICLIAYAMGWTDGLFQLALAALVLALCQTVRLPETALSRLCATAALGVYLCHPLVASVLERTTAITAHTLGFAIATGILAFMLTVTLGATRRFPFTLLFGPQPIGPLLNRLLRRA